MFTLSCDRAYLYAHPERELSAEEGARYEAALAERSRGVPAQYITGHQEFWGMDLIVTPAVLIPRPETEHVIEAVLQTLGITDRATGLGPRPSDVEPRAATLSSPTAANLEDSPRSEAQGRRSKVRIADVGTGSGCIALALAKELPTAEIHATDISADALEVARANAARHQLGDRIKFHQTDLLRGLPSGFDFVVSNPPYVGDSEADQVQREVKKFEPRMAVFAGNKGTEVISRLIPQAENILNPGGWLVMEISGSIAEETKHLLIDWTSGHYVYDLQSIPRVVVAQKAPLRL